MTFEYSSGHKISCHKGSYLMGTLSGHTEKLVGAAKILVGTPKILVGTPKILVGTSKND